MEETRFTIHKDTVGKRKRERIVIEDGITSTVSLIYSPKGQAVEVIINGFSLGSFDIRKIKKAQHEGYIDLWDYIDTVMVKAPFTADKFEAKGE